MTASIASGSSGRVLLGSGRLLLEVCPGDREPGGAREDGLAGQALVEHAAERVDVRAAVDRRAVELLGREVGGRADG